jgi:NitT/TauT family transport system substrate-binding protein
MVYNATPAAVFTLKKSGVSKPADLAGKTLAAPIFDAGRKAWPAFAKSNGLAVDAVKWQSVDPAIRETLLARGDVDGITGFYFTSLLNLEARGSSRPTSWPCATRTSASSSTATPSSPAPS